LLDPVTFATNCWVSVLLSVTLAGVTETVTTWFTVTVLLVLLVGSATLVAATVTVAGTGTPCGAVYSPLGDTVPLVVFPPATPFTLQVTDALEVPPTVAVNCCVWATNTDALAGDTVTETADTTVALACPL
jgi:hypothetical protein